MTIRNQGGPAFPRPHSWDESPASGTTAGDRPRDKPEQGGMSLRDWLAGQALVGLLASGPHDCEQDGIAYDAYLHADAMLEKRKE